MNYPTLSKQRLPFIDALRGLAILGVLAIHTSQYSQPLNSNLNQLVQQGKYGVQLFYVISAFTLFLSLSIRNSSELNSTRNFFLRRFFRIAPAFYCAVLFYWLRDGFEPRPWAGGVAMTPLSLLATLTFTNGFHPEWINSAVPGGWSIAVEMTFYLTIPWLYRTIKTLYGAVLFTGITLFFSLIIHEGGRRLVLTSRPELWDGFLYQCLPNQLPVFGLGFVLFFLCQRFPGTLSEDRIRRNQAYVILTMLLFLAISLAYGEGYPLLPDHFLYSLVFVGLSLVLWMHPVKLLVNQLTSYLGKISYSIYLVHFAILPGLQSLVNTLTEAGGIPLPNTLSYLLMLVLITLSTIIIGSITYQLIEVPSQAFGTYLIKKLGHQKSGLD